MGTILPLITLETIAMMRNKETKMKPRLSDWVKLK